MLTWATIYMYKLHKDACKVICKVVPEKIPYLYIISGKNWEKMSTFNNSVSNLLSSLNNLKMSDLLWILNNLRMNYLLSTFDNLQVVYPLSTSEFKVSDLLFTYTCLGLNNMPPLR